MGFGQVLAVGALALEEVRDGIQPQAVDALVEPEAKGANHLVLDGQVVEVQVGLVTEEAMPEVLARQWIPRPVRRLGVGEDDAGVFVLLVRIAPDVVIVKGRLRAGAGRLKPGMLVRRVVHDQLGDDPQTAAVGRLDKRLEVLEVAVGRLDVQVVGDVVAVVPLRRGVRRQQPQGGDPEILQVVELLDQAAEVADPIVVAVEEGLDVQLIQDRVLVPERVVGTGNATVRP